MDQDHCLCHPLPRLEGITNAPVLGLAPGICPALVQEFPEVEHRAPVLAGGHDYSWQLLTFVCFLHFSSVCVRCSGHRIWFMTFWLPWAQVPSSADIIFFLSELWHSKHTHPAVIANQMCIAGGEQDHHRLWPIHWIWVGGTLDAHTKTTAQAVPVQVAVPCLVAGVCLVQTFNSLEWCHGPWSYM